MAGGNDTLKDRVTRIKDFLGAPVADNAVNLTVQVEQLRVELVELRDAFSHHAREMEERTETSVQDMVALSGSIKARFEALDGEMALVKRATTNTIGTSEGVAVQKIKVPEPKPFQGTRNAKELENFLWDMEQYFKTVHIVDEERVPMTTMYLMGDAKLWWRTRVQEDQNGDKPAIVEWEVLKKELRAQFLPCNSAWLARESLKELKMGSSIRDYCKEFCSLMLDISNMSEEDKLFNFMAGLQPWAQTELRRQDVRDLTSALAVAERLLDYKAAGLRWEKKKVGADRKSRADCHVGHVGGGYSQHGPLKGSYAHHGPLSGSSKNVGAAPAAALHDKKGHFAGCFICKGSHLARNCPNKESAAAALSMEGVNNEGGQPEINTMVLLNAMSVEADPEMVGEFITDDPNALEIFVDMYVHSSGDITVLSSMVDAGAIVEMDEEMMPFMNSHSQTLEEAEIAAAHLTVSIWAGKLLGRKFDLYTALTLGELEMFAAFKPFSQQYEHYKKALSIYNYDWKLQAGRHDEMNYGPEMQEIIVLDDESEDMDMDQASEGEFLVFQGEDAAESDQEVIVVSEGSDDMDGDAAKSESSEEEEDPAEEDSMDSTDSVSSESASNEVEGQGWYNPAEVERQARLDSLVEKVCDELRLRSGRSDQAAVNAVWEEFAELAREQGKREGDEESTNQVDPMLKTTRASSGSSGGGLLPPC